MIAVMPVKFLCVYEVNKALFADIGKVIYERNIQTATAARIIPNIMLSIRALSGVLKHPAILPPIHAHIENAIRLLMVKTVVIKQTVTNHPLSD